MVREAELEADAALRPEQALVRPFCNALAAFARRDTRNASSGWGRYGASRIAAEAASRSAT